MDINSIINNVNIGKLNVNGTSMSYNQMLNNEVRRMRQLLYIEIKSYMSTYKPKMYVRTGAILKSIDVDSHFVINVSNNRMEISLNINNNAYHKSYFSPGSVDIIRLLNSGYKTTKPWFRDIEYFGWRKGAHFIEKAVERFNATSKYGVTAVFLE